MAQSWAVCKLQCYAAGGGGLSMIKKLIVLAAFFCLFLAGLSGCTAPIVFQGVSSGAPVAFKSTGRGQGESTWLARYDDVVQATLRAGQALSLQLEKKAIGPDQSIFHFIDDKGNKLQILIERRTESMTYAQKGAAVLGPVEAACWRNVLERFVMHFSPQNDPLHTCEEHWT